MVFGEAFTNAACELDALHESNKLIGALYTKHGCITLQSRMHFEKGAEQPVGAQPFEIVIATGDLHSVPLHASGHVLGMADWMVPYSHGGVVHVRS